MPRQAAGEAQKAAKTAGTDASQLYGPLSADATNLVNSKGYDPATLAAITNASMGANNAAFSGAAGQINRQAARSGNEGGTAGQQDTLAMNKGIAGGQAAGDVQIANANFQNQQKMAGLNMLGSMYGTNVNAQAPL